VPLPLVLILQPGCPGDVVHGAGTGELALFRGRVKQVQARAGVCGDSPGTVAQILETEHPGQDLLRSLRRGGVGTHAVESADRVFRRDFAVKRHQRLFIAVVDEEFVLESFGVGEQQSGLSGVDTGPGQTRVHLGCLRPGARGLEALGPVGERLNRWEPPQDPVDHARSGPARLGAGVLEEGQVEAGAAVLIAVEEVIDGRVVLIDGSLDQPHPEKPGIKLHVPGGIAGDAADVMDAVEADVAHPAKIPVRGRGPGGGTSSACSG